MLVPSLSKWVKNLALLQTAGVGRGCSLDGVAVAVAMA